jgi:hypothetical protein
MGSLTITLSDKDFERGFAYVKNQIELEERFKPIHVSQGLLQVGNTCWWFCHKFQIHKCVIANIAYWEDGSRRLAIKSVNSDAINKKIDGEPFKTKKEIDAYTKEWVASKIAYLSKRN